MQTGEVWVIDNDTDDHEIVRNIWRELGIANELVFFETADEVMQTFEKTNESPFIILCDLNLPKTDGFQLREILLSKQAQRFRSVPFIYWSTFASDEQITHAYDLSAHGFFIKDATVKDLKETFTLIINYWLKSKMPPKKLMKNNEE